MFFMTNRIVFLALVCERPKVENIQLLKRVSKPQQNKSVFAIDEGRSKNKQTWQGRIFAKRIIFAQDAANISTKFQKESLWEAPTTDACVVSRLVALEDLKAIAEVALTGQIGKKSFLENMKDNTILFIMKIILKETFKRDFYCDCISMICKSEMKLSQSIQIQNMNSSHF